MAELRIGCLVMAAGSGSRFGRNKLEAVIDGKTLLRRALEAVPRAEFACVTVVTQYDGAAALAGLACGLWKSREELRALRRSDRVFRPRRVQSECDEEYRLWKRAVSRAADWIEH